MYQTYLDAFKLFLQQGHTHLEALSEFDRQRFHEAVCAEKRADLRREPFMYEHC